MCTQSSDQKYPGTLRNAVFGALLVCAGWCAGGSAALADELAAPCADTVQTSADAAPVVSAPGATQSDAQAAPDDANRLASETMTPPADASQNANAHDDSVNAADSVVGKKVFVTGSSVTRYDVASLDDRVLSNQHGRAVGMLMVAAVPDAMRNNSVTLWDEIAPPTQTPQPIGAAGAAQNGNVVNYTRK
ncbi:hypothetical protein [Pararobbsia silviterrae]|uniref:PRC-barrel domain containing protein n=1 Tax=Pararobbsia silviterrae TaxID=1792498 RepID=A0A494YGN0_9BURK|nr:hypothetical protein [Pararobbsia silviterrae]RKP59187.1 hypothetical protein D7S86_04635 [Pararobbsia silviterrae]